MGHRSSNSGWVDTPPVQLPPDQREAHVRFCSLFAGEMLDRYPEWREDLDLRHPLDLEELRAEVETHGLEAGLRLYRNRTQLRIIWNDLCGLAPIGEVFDDLGSLAEHCLQVAVDENSRLLREKFGTPRSEDGVEQQIFVIAMGKFGGGELNLSSDIDVMFCYPKTGECDGRRRLSNDQFFIRLSRRVISSLSDLTVDGFCFRVDARLRPFGQAGPLAASIASMTQYYQNEGRDWERYALIKARPVAGDLASGAELLSQLQPFVYRRYIDFGSVESMHEMHASVHEDARRKDRSDDIKRGPGGIREIEFLAQSFQILRGGREPSLQTPYLDTALHEIEALGLLPAATVSQIRNDYMFLRRLENRIQALRDQQTHRVPGGEDGERIACAMGFSSIGALEEALSEVRRRVSWQFEQIFPERKIEQTSGKWTDKWRQLQDRQQSSASSSAGPVLTGFLDRLARLALSPRARDRLDRFMPILLGRLDRKPLDEPTLDRVFELVLTICPRSAYLSLLVQNEAALDRMLELFARSRWIADTVIRFPALLDELIDPSLGHQIPNGEELSRSISRLVEPSRGTENSLEGLNYLKLATRLRIAVAQLESDLSAGDAQKGLSELASAILHGVLLLASREVESRHGRMPINDSEDPASDDSVPMAIIAYGTLGANELGYRSDLDLVFLFQTAFEESDGKRPLTAERYFARIARRVLSFLTVMTPSGKLYEVDTRLRPNGRAGALVSSVDAFRDYQLNEAWTWEMQALTRARFVSGHPALESAFEQVRRQALVRQRNLPELKADLLDMRQKMANEHQTKAANNPAAWLKHQPGGLIDIEFIAQFGILASAASSPGLIEHTDSIRQLEALSGTGWLNPDDLQVLLATRAELSRLRLLVTLLTLEHPDQVDTTASAALFEKLIGLMD